MASETNGANGASATNSSNGFPAEGTSFVIPKECKAGVVYNEGPDFYMKVEMVPVPEPGPNDVLIKLNCTGLCYSDIHFMLNDLGGTAMSASGVRSPGHEGAGVVVKVGAAVTNWKVGDRAGIKPIMDICGKCELCFDDKEVYCEQAVHCGNKCTGSYQQYLVSPAKYTQPIPEGVPDYLAAPIMCSASTMYRSLTESGLKPGNWACFPGGGGGVGIQGVQLARAMGFRPVVIDAGAQKRELALRLGAEAFVDFKETPDVAAEVVKVADGIGVHGVFVTAPAAYKTAVSLTGKRIGAIIMCIGLPSGGAGKMIVGGDPAVHAFRNLTVKGTIVGSLHDTTRALDFARRGMLKEICEVVPIDQLPEYVQKLKRGEIAGRIVCDYNMQSPPSPQAHI